MELKSKLALLKSKINNVREVIKETHPDNAITVISKMTTLDKMKQVLENKDIVQLNIGGEIFSTSKSTIKKFPESLLAAIIEHEKYDGKELFFDRSPLFFPIILHFLRYNEIKIKNLKKIDIENLKREVEFYEFSALDEILSKRLQDIQIVSFEVNGDYLFKGQKIGNATLKDLENKSLKMGSICVSGTGYIIFKLNCEWDITSVDIGPYIGDIDKGWKSNYGIGTQILTSSNKVTWTSQGEIPTSYSSKIINIPFNSCTGVQFIKLQAKSNLGISYIKFNKEELV